MPFRDVYPDPGNGESQDFIEVPLPVDPDDYKEWCEDFNLNFGDGRMHTSVDASYYHKETTGPYASMPSFYRFRAEDPRDDPMHLKGRVRAAGIRVDYRYYDEYFLYLLMDQVVARGAGPQFDYPTQRFLVPLKLENSVKLHY